MKRHQDKRDDCENLKEEVKLLSELYIVNKAKDDSELPIALETLDFGGLTFPKKTAPTISSGN